jgi:hypothetical protein
MDPPSVLWWVPASHRPDPVEGRAKREVLAAVGDSPQAFTFQRPFPPPEAPDLGLRALRDKCPA